MRKVESSKAESSKAEPTKAESSEHDSSKPEYSDPEWSGHDSSKRSQLLRRIVTFQLKLMADGLRDLILMPVSLVAALIGYTRGGDEPDRELNQLMDYGRQTEEWIDLFDQRGGDEHRDSRSAHSLASIDAVFNKVEKSLKQSYRSGETSEGSQSEIDEALNAAHEKARKSAGGSTTDSSAKPAE